MAAGGITAAAVWVDVIPSAKRLGKDLARDARAAGQQTGKTIAEETGRSISQRASAIGSSIARTFTRVQAAAVTAGQRIGQAFSGGVEAARNALGRFATGWSALDVATARSAGGLGRFGAAARSAFDTAARPAQNFIAGFRNADAAASALTGRMGTFGGRARSAFDTATRPMQNFVAGFRSSEAAASAFTGRLGTIGGAARNAFTTAAAPVQNFVAGFRSSEAAASAFTGRLGTIGGAARSAFGGAATAVSTSMSGMASASRTALTTAVQPLNNFVAGFRNSSAAASAFSGRMGTVGGAVSSALSSAQSGFSNFTSQVRSQASQIETSITSGIGGSMRGIAGMAAGLAAAAGFATLGSSAFSAASNIQNTELTLTGLYGSAESAGDMMGRLKTLAAGSPIDYQAYARASTQLAYMGIEGAQAEGVLRNVGAAITAAGGDSGAMDRASGAMLQMVNSGRVYAAQLGQISDAGIPVFSGLATHFNTNIDNVRTMVTEGKVSIDDVMSVIENATGDTYQSMVAASDQVTGSMSNQWAIFKDNVITGLGQMLVPLTQAVGPAIGALGKSIGDAMGRLPGIMAEIGQTWWFQGIVAGLRAIWEFIAPVVGGVAQMAAVVARPAFAIFGAILGGIGQALAWVLPYLRPLQPILVGIAAAFAAGVTAMAIYNGAVYALAAAKAAAALAVRAFNLAFMANPLGIVIGILIALTAAVVYAWHNFDWFRAAVVTAWEWSKTAAMAVWTGFLQPIFDGIVAAIGWVIDNWRLLAIGIGILFPPLGMLGAAIYLLIDNWHVLVAAAQWCWDMIAAGALWLWNTVLSPVFSFISTAVQILIAVIFTVLVTPLILAWNMISAATMWLWTNAIQPAFNGIGSFIGWVWTALILPAVSALVAFWQNVIAPAALWLWNSVIVPAFQGIGTFITWVWTAIIQPALQALVWFWQNVIAPAAMLLWNWVIVPAFTGIATIIQWAWLYIIQPALAALVWFWQQVLAPAAIWLYQNIIRPMWEGIGNTISWVWNNIIRPAFDAVKQGLQWVGEKFDQVTNWIGDIWNKIRGFLAKPINFMINTVWNSGIVPAWNAVAAILPGVDPIAPQRAIPEARTGGRLDSRGMIRGPGTGVSDSVLAQVTETDEPLAVSNREFVVNAAATRRHLPLLTALNGGAQIGDQRNQRRGLAGGGPVGWQDLWATVRGQFPNARLTSSKRNTNDFHGAGTAIDVAGPRSMDMPFMLNVNRWLGGRFPQSAELIHTQPGAVNLKNGRPHTYNAGTRAGHRNHVHWANNGGEAGEGGGLWGFISTFFRDQVENLFVKATDPMLDAIRGLLPAPPPAWNKVPAETAVTMRDKLKEWLFSKADDEDSKAGAAGGEIDVSGISGPVVDQVQQVAARMGYGSGPEWEAIKWIIQKESGWNPGAANPTSSARGLMQKMTSVHGPVEPTPAGQAAWGINYMNSRYGSPTAAKRFWQANGHYDAGGLAYGKGVLLKDVIAPERVLPPRETQSYETLTKLSQRLDAGVVRVRDVGDDTGTGSSGRGDVHLHVHGDVHDPVDVDMLGQRIEFATRGVSL